MNQTKIGKYLLTFENSEEFHIIKKEIFGDKIYFIESKYLPNNSPVILDIGAHIGLASLYFTLDYPAAKIYALEPNKLNFEILQENLNQNSLVNITALNLAISNNTGTTPFYIDSSEDKWFSTGGFIKSAWNGKQNTNETIVDSITLLDLIKKLDIKTIGILKLDIEGFEQRLLKNSTESLKIVSNIIFEYHPTSNQSIVKIDKILRSNGFKQVFSGRNLKLEDTLTTYHYTKK